MVFAFYSNTIIIIILGVAYEKRAKFTFFSVIVQGKFQRIFRILFTFFGVTTHCFTKGINMMGIIWENSGYNKGFSKKSYKKSQKTIFECQQVSCAI